MLRAPPHTDNRLGFAIIGAGSFLLLKGIPP